MARVTFASSSNGVASAASQAKFNLTTPALQIVLTGATLKAIGAGVTRAVIALVNNDNYRIRIRRNGTNLELTGGITSQGVSSVVCSADVTSIADADLICVSLSYSWAASVSTLTGSFVKSDGTSLASGNGTIAGAAIANANSSINVWDVTNTEAANIAGAAVFSAAPVSTYLNPSSDPNLVALYYMDNDGTGKVKDWVSGGTSLTVTNGTLDATADYWDPITATTTPAFGRFGVRGPVR
jgi:hypothetical protein